MFQLVGQREIAAAAARCFVSQVEAEHKSRESKKFMAEIIDVEGARGGHQIT